MRLLSTQSKRVNTLIGLRNPMYNPTAGIASMLKISQVTFIGRSGLNPDTYTGGRWT